MKELTVEQGRVLSFIASCVEKIGVPPSMREIAAHFGYRSVNNVRQHLRLIAAKGYIRLREGTARGIELVAGFQRDARRRVPLVGAVAAGKPVTAIENIDEYITLDSEMFKGDGLFTLRVKGDSMSGMGVLDGDIAVIHQQNTASNNDVVVAIIDEEATLKRFFRRGDHVVLHAENPRYEDLVLDSGKNVAILGKMIGVIRKY